MKFCEHWFDITFDTHGPNRRLIYKFVTGLDHNYQVSTTHLFYKIASDYLGISRGTTSVNMSIYSRYVNDIYIRDIINPIIMLLHAKRKFLTTLMPAASRVKKNRLVASIFIRTRIGNVRRYRWV